MLIRFLSGQDGTNNDQQGRSRVSDCKIHQTTWLLSGRGKVSDDMDDTYDDAKDHEHLTQTYLAALALIQATEFFR
ncbi:hypothetical protein [Arthrobacter sp. 260]|uniref:hypothetical protein n=1 Tax=Arthrobacter sp. 260 TaxID=2735314 RepID=UPI00149124FB|nr:hypothetical protein [Arthrobacter sp. 260]NOJ60933.1 hypothetical protein [Arthrobacter sp. 260]